MKQHPRWIAFLGLIVCHPCCADDWPTWQHDNRRTGATEEQLETEKLTLDWTWKSSSPPQTAWAGPAKYDAYAFHRNLPSMRNYDPVFHMIAVEDRIWFGSSVDDSLYCLRADDGSEQWVVTTDAPVRLAPTYSQGRVYFGSDDGLARCVDSESGRLLWKFSPVKTDRLVLNNGRLIPFQPCRTGVVVEDGTAWFACAMLPWKDSYLCAVDAETGRADSTRHFVKTLPGRTMEGVPALSSNALILPQGRVAPRVFDRYSGEDRGDMAKSGGGSVVVVSLDENVLHGPASDSRKGGFRQSSSQSREMVAALGRGNALVVDGTDSWMLTDDEIVASELTTQEIQWKEPTDCPFSMIKAGDTLFVGGDQIVAAHSAKDGRRLWQQPADGRVFGLVVANGRLFASSDTGVIHCYSTNEERRRGKAKETAVAISGSEIDANVADLEPIDDPRLLGHWAFQRSSITGNRVTALHGPDLALSNAARFSRLGKYQVLELDGVKETAMVSPSFQQVPHPETAFTAEAWVRIDQFKEWGGIIGIAQDNGSDEKGWLLGYRNDRFCVAVSSSDGPGKLTYLTADEPFETAQWYHVAGSYDGRTMRLYVNGRQCAQSDEQSGSISYPERAWFEIGAYHDDDEYYRLAGAVHEVRLYEEAISPSEASDHYHSSKARMPSAAGKAQLDSGPWLTFDDPETATVRWTTKDPQSTWLVYGSTALSQTMLDKTPRLNHQAVLTGLTRNRVYRYRIGTHHGEDLRLTQEFEIDNFFNYSPPSATRISGSTTASSQSLAQQLLEQTDERRGLCLILGGLDPEVLVELCRRSQWRFVLAEPDKNKVDASRSMLRKCGVYGNQVSVYQRTDLTNLDFPGNWANLVVVTARSTQELIREAQRQTRPDGGVTLIIDGSSRDLSADFQAIATKSDALWFRFVKPALAGSADWSHLYGTPDNSAFTGEQLGGAKSADDLEVQWVGRPGPRYQADRSGRKPSPLTTGGRLFLQGLHRIIAVDAFNGTVLWSLEIPGMERFNMPRDCSNWCGTRDFLFVAVKGECWKIDTVTGEVLERIPAAGSESEVPMDWGYVATDVGRLYGSAVRTETSWTSFWGGADAGWYDARSGAVTHPICSDRLFCRDAGSLEPIWEYRRGVVLNPTITVSGDTMYFVESRNDSILASDQRRIGNAALWKDLHLVAIDAGTGSAKWEKRLDPMDPQVVIYLAHAAGQLTLVTSSDQSYKVSSCRDSNGTERWTQTTPWPGGKGDHGKAMMRPAIVGDRIFLRPDVLSVKDGSVLPEKMPDGHGCGTYSCTANAVFYRAQTITMWNPDSKLKSTWPRLRSDCWLSTIPASGMLLSPEAGGGCSCGAWMETSIGFLARTPEPGSEQR